MSIITALLNGTNLNRDSHIETPNIMTLTQGVRKGFTDELEITTSLCNKGMALVEVTRTTVTPNETFLVLVWITANETIDTSGDGYIVLKIDAAKIADGSSNNVDGTGIATVEKVAVLPSSNFLELCSLASGVITNTRKYCTFQDNILPFAKHYALDAGASDAYAISITGLKEYVDGMVVAFKANTLNTGPATLNINSLGAKAIVKNFNTALETGDILANQIVAIRYNSTNDEFIVTNHAGSAIDTSVFIKKDGTRDFTANQSMGTHKLTGVVNPTAAQDAATKNYVDGVKDDGQPVAHHAFNKTFIADDSAETQYETVSIPAGFTAGMIKIDCYVKIYSSVGWRFFTGVLHFEGLTSKGYQLHFHDSEGTEDPGFKYAISGNPLFDRSAGWYRNITVSINSLTAGDGNDLQIKLETTIGVTPGVNSSDLYCTVSVWPA